jgi:ABC-2 type transport system ATP-binding protein
MATSTGISAGEPLAADTSTGPAASPPPGGIVVSGVSRAFGEVHAVRSASFEALPGQVTALIGPNGSGKTTLLLMLASLLAPDNGTILVDGVDPVKNAAGVRRAMGWMPDILGSWPALSVRTTLELTGRMYELTSVQSAARASELIELVGLEELADQPTRVLSRGQKQRLSLARALVHNPSVLLLDEPASGLDPVARIALRELVRSLADEGKTIIVSSHVLAELDEMADTAIYLNKGVTASVESVQNSKRTARLWRIRAADTAALRAALEKSGIAASAISTDRVELLVPLEGEAAAASLLTTLVTGKVAISTFAPAVGDLEHTFLDLSRNDSPAASETSTAASNGDTK